MESRDSIEKRKHPRFKVKERVFVELSVNPIRIGEIIDISVSGLSFRYIANGDIIQNSLEIKIYHSQSKFISEKMTVRTVWDGIIIPKFWTGIIKTRRRGVFFENLNENQKSQIEQFIQNYTISEA